jgi:hypothetical protein
MASAAGARVEVQTASTIEIKAGGLTVELRGCEQTNGAGDRLSKRSVMLIIFPCRGAVRNSRRGQCEPAIFVILQFAIRQ